MKRTIFGLVTVLLALSMVLAGCAGPMDPMSSLARKASNGMSWNAGDADVAADIEAVPSQRKNASGPKIPSNAHSGDFPGIYFIWDSKQKDDGYLKVEGWVFDKYENFTLTAKVSNEYWDFPIAVQDEQQTTSDGCYAFFIPKISELKARNHNINMVFIPAFVLKEKDPVDPIGQITILKTVDGIEINAWAKKEGYAVSDLIEAFNLYAVEKDGADIEGLTPIASQNVDELGSLLFTKLEDGWYAVEEVFTEEGWKVFVPVGIKYFQIINSIPFGLSNEFDYNAFYTIGNGYGSGYVLGYSGLNNSGDIFPISVKTIDDEGNVIEYPSFCANGGSRAFAGESGMGCAGYMVAVKEHQKIDVNFDNFMKAYNYIEDTFGSLNDNRAVTQIVTWALLGSIDINSAAFDNINWNTVESGAGAVKGVADAKNTVKSVMDNYVTHKGSGKITDIVFLACEHDHDYYDCQPQLVPVYGSGREFRNTVKEPELPPPPPSARDLGDSVTATNVNDPHVVPNSNHFTYAVLDRAALADGVDLMLVIGNKITKVGDAFVQLVDGKLVITIIDQAPGGNWGALAFNYLPELKNGNIHSMKEFSHDGKLTIACPAGDTIYLYFHSNGVRVYN